MMGERSRYEDQDVIPSYKEIHPFIELFRDKLRSEMAEIFNHCCLIHCISPSGSCRVSRSSCSFHNSFDHWLPGFMIINPEFIKIRSGDFNQLLNYGERKVNFWSEESNITLKNIILN